MCESDGGGNFATTAWGEAKHGVKRVPRVNLGSVLHGNGLGEGGPGRGPACRFLPPSAVGFSAQSCFGCNVGWPLS